MLKSDEPEAYADYENLVVERDALRAEVDSLKQHIERLVTEKDGCAKNWYDCRADLAAAVGVIKTIANHGPYIDSEFGGGECFYCGGAWSNYTGKFKHTKDCTYEKARAFIKRMEDKQ